jgi:hypothetical protein
MNAVFEQHGRSQHQDRGVSSPNAHDDGGQKQPLYGGHFEVEWP